MIGGGCNCTTAFVTASEPTSDALGWRCACSTTTTIVIQAFCVDSALASAVGLRVEAGPAPSDDVSRGCAAGEVAITGGCRALAGSGRISSGVLSSNVWRCQGSQLDRVSVICARGP